MRGPQCDSTSFIPRGARRLGQDWGLRASGGLCPGLFALPSPTRAAAPERARRVSGMSQAGRAGRASLLRTGEAGARKLAGVGSRGVAVDVGVGGRGSQSPDPRMGWE